MSDANSQSAVEEQEQIGTLIAEIQKNSRERLRITVGQYKGHEYVGIRVWYVGTDGQYRPSKSTKGYDLMRVLAALDKAKALAATDLDKRSKKTRDPTGRAIPLYHVDPDALVSDE